MPNMSFIRIQFLKVHILRSRHYGFVKMQTAYFKTIGCFKNSRLCSSKQDYLLILFTVN